MEPYPPDPMIDEIRAIRRKISAEHGHDPKRLVEHYMEFQQQFADRLVAPPEPRPVFVLCLSAGDHPASLQARKVYQFLPSAADLRKGLVRVIDESGTDHLYPWDLFVPVELPAEAVETLLAGATAA